MGKHYLREDKTCENCGHTVEIAYCSNCGQKNTETRQSFGHLVTHFIEDFTHYDGAFWKTIKYLMFRPAKLTKEYLAGKRQVYVAPVKLYIFISFITFFLPGIIPGLEKEYEETIKPNLAEVTHVSIEEKINTKQNVYLESIGTEYIQNPMTYSSLREMDSIEKIKPKELRLNAFEYNLGKRLLKIYSHSTPEEVHKKYLSSVGHNTSKALFLYLPIFAFCLWLFHGKKRWYFFDHSIFTLHYFSFLLLSFLGILFLLRLAIAINSEIFSMVAFCITFLIMLGQMLYFFIAHKRMYNESWIVSITKSIALFFINFTLIVITFIILMTVTMYTLH